MPHDVVDVGTDLVVNHLLDAYCDCAATGSNVGQHQLPIHSHRDAKSRSDCNLSVDIASSGWQSGGTHQSRSDCSMPEFGCTDELLALSFEYFGRLPNTHTERETASRYPFVDHKKYSSRLKAERVTNVKHRGGIRKNVTLKSIEAKKTPLEAASLPPKLCSFSSQINIGPTGGLAA
eukprot:scaffold45052_cov32-Tisochrysis_lutea.AAC.3